jgi:heme-degrading monooxygenase HmoA
MENLIAQTPEPPYYVVVFTAILSADLEGYESMAVEMLSLAHQQPGFLGYEYAGSEMELTISYWESLEAIQNWGQNSEHRKAKKAGKELWFKNYRIRIARVERDSHYHPFQ